MEFLAVAYDAVPLFETLKDSLFHISALLFDVAKVVQTECNDKRKAARIFICIAEVQPTLTQKR